MMSTKTMLMVVNVDWLFLLHRLEIAKKASLLGWEVIVVAKATGSEQEIESHGFKFINIDISRLGTNPIKEFSTFYQIYLLYKKIRPNVVYQATMKPVIYGTLVSKFLKLNTLNSISGLGYNFTNEREGWVQKIMIIMMRFGFKKQNNSLIFENKEDYLELKKLEIINHKNKVTIIKGIGVDLKKFTPVTGTINDKVKVLLPARMLWDKGVKEFVEVALMLKNKFFGKAIFILCGRLDMDNPEAVPEKFLIENKIPNYLEWIGYQEDMVKQYSDTDIVVLPSYREGLPVSLMEACAMGKPIVTTNAIGCKECVDHNVNGYKVPVKSVKELALAIEKLILDPELRKSMGVASRKKAEKEFDKNRIVQKHLKLCETLIVS